MATIPVLGKVEKIDDLRKIWKHEASDFSKWLAEEDNLRMLSDAIGIDISLDELESSVGDFNVDIYGTEEGTDRKVIIENQLEYTNHDHLGKIITYAAGKNAQIIVWVVKHARDEHRQAIDWLNDHTDETLGFFLVEVELWKIADSPVAAMFNVVAQPNNWAKVIKGAGKLTEGKKIWLDFWQRFVIYSEKQAKFNKISQTSHTENIPYALINQLELNVESHSRTLLCTQTTHPKSGQIVQESFQERFDQQDF